MNIDEFETKVKQLADKVNELGMHGFFVLAAEGPKPGSLVSTIICNAEPKHADCYIETLVDGLKQIAPVRSIVLDSVAIVADEIEKSEKRPEHSKPIN